MCEQKYNYLSSQTSHQTLHLFAWPTINLILNSQHQPTNCPVLVVSVFARGVLDFALHLGWDMLGLLQEISSSSEPNQFVESLDLSGFKSWKLCQSVSKPMIHAVDQVLL